MVHQTWSNHLDYLLTLLGYSVGVGQFWKFPYLCMRNGGGAFLIPFILFTVIGVIPVVFLEMTIGQFSQSGPVKVWNLCPPFKGMGVGMLLMALFFNTYYSVLFSWFLYYLYHSFMAIIPWADCNNDWNTPTCISHINVNTTTDAVSFGQHLVPNVRDRNSTCQVDASTNISDRSVGMTAAEEFWRFKVLDITDGLEYLGGLRWPLVGCHVLVYISLFLIMFKGIKISGKIVYVTVAIPFILITAFLIHGCLLPGSADGIYYYMYPRLEKLMRPEIWIEGCSFALYSLGVASGCITTMSGHCDIRRNCYRDSLILVIVDSVSAVYFGFAFFAIIGHVAHLRGVTVEAFESSGFNLGFIVYPEAVASLPLPQLWSALSFLILLTLGLDSALPAFEIAVTAMADRFPRFSHRHRWLLYAAILLPCFLVGLVYLTQGGMYVLTLVDWYVIFPSISVFAMLECFVVSWVYGTDSMKRDISYMWGKTVPRVMYFAMKFICPTLFLVVFCYSLYSYRPPKYGDYIYPAWATGIGWIISFASIIPVPIIFIWTVYKAEGNTWKEKITQSMMPNMKWNMSANTNSNNSESMM